MTHSISQVAQSGILHTWQEIYVPSCICGRCLYHTACMIPEPLSKEFMFQYDNLQSRGIRNSILKRSCLGCQQYAMIIFWGPLPNCTPKLISSSIQRMGRRRLFVSVEFTHPRRHPHLPSPSCQHMGSCSALQSIRLNKPDCFPVFLYKTLNIHRAIKLNEIL